MFEIEAPYYMAIGMTYEQYWYGDPLMVRDFFKAHQLRVQMKEYDAWLQGAYIKAAIESSIGNAFLPKGHSPNKYPDPPEIRSIDDDKKLAQARKEEEKRKERLKAKSYFDNLLEAQKRRKLAKEKHEETLNNSI